MPHKLNSNLPSAPTQRDSVRRDSDDRAPNKTFTLILDTSQVPLEISRKAQLEFELHTLETMDECLLDLSDHLTPANALHLRPNPLDMVGKMMIESANTGNTPKLMLCALWVGHHYPSLRSLNVNDMVPTFTDTPPVQGLS